METGASVIIVALVIAVYFIPALNAAARKHHNQNAIFLLNLFLGWTFLGWVAALIWSATAIPQEYQQLAQQTQQPSRTTIRRRGVREHLIVGSVKRPLGKKMAKANRRTNMRKVKGILIDPFTCTVTEVEHDGDDYNTSIS